MAIFRIIGDTEPFLHVSMEQGEVIYGQSDSMVTMDFSIDLAGSMKGGVMRSTIRKKAKNQSFFLQKFIAHRGHGDCLLAPSTSGGIHVINVGAKQYKFNDGTFLAMSENVTIKTSLQKITNSIFGNTGGLIIGKTSGIGSVAFSGYGSIHEIHVTEDNPVTVDNGHIVAWDENLDYNIRLTTSRGRNIISNLISPATTGEGIVLEFRGDGKIILCSRNMIDKNVKS